MSRANVDPNFIVVDIRDVITDYASNRLYYSLYRHFPLQDIIQCILYTQAYEDNGEFFWVELDRRLDESNTNETFDLDAIAIFHEILTEYLDQYIRSKLPASIDNLEFVFHKWANPTTVILEKDNNAKSSRRSM